MSVVLAFVAVQDGEVKRSSLETLSAARAVAQKHGRRFEAVALTAQAGGIEQTVARYGAERLHLVENEAFAKHNGAATVSTLASVIESVKPDVVVFPSTEGVKDILGALAIRCGADAVPDVASFDIDGDRVIAKRPVMAAKFVARVHSKGLPALVSVRAGSYSAEEAPADIAVVRSDAVVPEGRTAILREVLESALGTVDLTDARVVVAAGRGVRDEEGRRLVQELADVFGAAIGSSRAVVENGLFPATSQIGQTGKVVSPDLYFAIGISGAIQHAAGMQNSRVIVAINKDADAPIFKYATYGIVGDLFKVLPPMIDALRKATN
jgi:electron transfer flavoprotein alpha subunit